MLRTKAPGLRWRKQASGRVPVWVADREAVRAGFLPQRIDLGHLADNPEMLKARCAVLQAEMRLWLTGYRHASGAVDFDGSVRHLLALYLSHPQSRFQKLRPGTVRTYRSCAQRLSALIGEQQIAAISGVDLVRWHDDWSHGDVHLAAAAGLRNVLLAAASFGVMLRLPGCAELVGIIRATSRTFRRLPPRSIVLSADEIVAVRAAAHAHGAPSRALAYAIVFETTLRLYDVIGIWWLGDPPLWFGLTWEHVDDDLVLRYMPSKTSASTGITVVYPLTSAPMVMEELRHWPLKRRAGPMIVCESTGDPYIARTFQDGWRKDRKAAGLSQDAWARDLRASGITEARAAGAAIEDAAKVAGHSTSKTTSTVYDRAALEAAQRFAEARKAARDS